MTGTTPYNTTDDLIWLLSSDEVASYGDLTIALWYVRLKVMVVGGVCARVCHMYERAVPSTAYTLSLSPTPNLELALAPIRTHPHAHALINIQL